MMIFLLSPPLDEQRRIAAVLDKVSDLIAKRRAQLDKLDELVKAQFVEMFGDPERIQAMASTVHERNLQMLVRNKKGSIRGNRPKWNTIIAMAVSNLKTDIMNTGQCKNRFIPKEL